MRDTQAVVEKLGKVRAALLAEARHVPAEHWGRRPPSGGWSVAEVIAHLTMAETAHLEGAKKKLSKEPRHVPRWKRLHLPVRCTAWRLIRVKSPLPVDPALLEEKDAMLARFQAVREATLEFLRTHSHSGLQQWRFRHPFLGSLNGYDWFEMMSYHEVRHTKQIREIMRSD